MPHIDPIRPYNALIWPKKHTQWSSKSTSRAYVGFMDHQLLFMRHVRQHQARFFLNIGQNSTFLGSCLVLVELSTCIPFHFFNTFSLFQNYFPPQTENVVPMFLWVDWSAFKFTAEFYYNRIMIFSIRLEIEWYCVTNALLSALTALMTKILCFGLQGCRFFEDVMFRPRIFTLDQRSLMFSVVVLTFLLTINFLTWQLTQRCQLSHVTVHITMSVSHVTNLTCHSWPFLTLSRACPLKLSHMRDSVNFISHMTAPSQQSSASCQLLAWLV